VLVPKFSSLVSALHPLFRDFQCFAEVGKLEQFNPVCWSSYGKKKRFEPGGKNIAEVGPLVNTQKNVEKL